MVRDQVGDLQAGQLPLANEYEGVRTFTQAFSLSPFRLDETHQYER